MSDAGTAVSADSRDRAWVIRLAAIALMLGAGFAFGHFEGVGQLPVAGGREWFGLLWAQAWQLFGIAFIGLLPLACWLLVLVWKHLICRQNSGCEVQLDLAFITRNGPLLGLLGTVVALASAGATLALEVESGSASAVLGIIPLVGQALLSTIAGIVLAVGADAALHVIERREMGRAID